MTSLKNGFERQQLGFQNATVERAKALDAPFQKFKTVVVNTNVAPDPVLSASGSTFERPEDIVTTHITDTRNLVSVKSFSVDKITIPLSFETVNFFSFTETNFNDPTFQDFQLVPNLLLCFSFHIFYYQQRSTDPFGYVLNPVTVQVDIRTDPNLGTEDLGTAELLVRQHWTPTTFASKINEILRLDSVFFRLGLGEFVPNNDGLRNRHFPTLGTPRSFSMCYDIDGGRFQFVRAPPLDPLPATLKVSDPGTSNTVIDQVQVAVRSSRLAALLGFGARRDAFTVLFAEARTPTGIGVANGAQVTKVFAPLPAEPFGPAFLRLRSTLPVPSPHLGEATSSVLALVPVIEGLASVELIAPSTEFESVFTFPTPQNIESTQTFWFEDDQGNRVYFIHDRRWSVTMTFEYIPC